MGELSWRLQPSLSIRVIYDPETEESLIRFFKMHFKRSLYLTQKFNKFIGEHKEQKQCKKLCCLPTTINSVKQLSKSYKDLRSFAALAALLTCLSLQHEAVAGSVCPKHHVQRFCLSCFTLAFWNTDESQPQSPRPGITQLVCTAYWFPHLSSLDFTPWAARTLCFCFWKTSVVYLNFVLFGVFIW